MNLELSKKGELRLASRLAWMLAVVTVVTFALAMLAAPISGANAPGGGIPYPYLETQGQYPKDFLWQYSALAQLVILVSLFQVVGCIVPATGKPLYHLSRIFIRFSALVLLVTYYVQVTVVPVSLRSHEMDGLALLIQYNPHGIFIALEELGYLLMLFGFALFAMSLGNEKGRRRAIQVITGGFFLSAILALVLICAFYGLDKKDRVEVILISCAWLMTIIDSILLASLLQIHHERPTASQGEEPRNADCSEGAA